MNQVLCYCIVIVCAALVQIASLDHVNPRINVTCNGTTTLPNITFEKCLINPMLCFRNDCNVNFDSGVHHVLQLDYTGMCVIQNVRNLSLEGKDGTVIDCAKRASFGFINVSVLNITDIHFTNCGVNITEKIPQLINKTVVLPLTLQPDQKIGIFLLNVLHLFLNNVEIYNSLGYGLLGINLLGTSIIENCFFTKSNYEMLKKYANNTLDCFDPENLGKCNGGNAFFIYADLLKNDAIQHQVDANSLTLLRANASEGVNLVNGLSQQNHSYNPSSIHNLVSGGGISLLLLQVNFTVNFALKNSFSTSNVGFTGANIYINVFYYVLNSSISVDNVEILLGNDLLIDRVATFVHACYGGGMYYEYGNYFKDIVPALILKHGLNIGYNISLSNLYFLHNNGLSGGGLYMKFHLMPMNTVHITHSLNIDQCRFVANRAYFGAGIHINELQYKQILNSEQSMQKVFSCNIRNTLFEYHHHADPCVNPSTTTFFNAAIASTIFLNEIQSYFKMQNVTIVKSYGCTGILLINSIVLCDGITIANNENDGNGGGAILNGQSYFILSPNSVFLIQNNTAMPHKKGGGIYIPTITSYNFQPLCFFQVLPKSEVSSNISDITDYNASINIVNNNAEIGYDIYGGDLEKCFLLFWDVETTKAYNMFIKTDDRNDSSKIASYAETICFCVDERENCSMRSITVSAYPGQIFSAHVVPVGQLNGTTESDSLTIDNPDIQKFNVTISDVNIHLKKSCGKVNFIMSTIFNPQTATKGIFFYLFVNGVLDRFYWKYIYVNIMPCPPFLYYNNASGVCDCLPVLEEYCTASTNHNDSVRRPAASYIGYVLNCTYVYHYCPINHCGSSAFYINASEQDDQCVHNRKGIMCAECKDGFSRMIGSSHCVKCNNVHLLVILLFALIGIGLVWFISFFNLTVSNGMINGIIFYANIVKVNKDILYPSVSERNVLSLIIAWINLDYGFETCLFNGMTEFHKALLQLTFPVYLWILSMLAIYLTRHYRIMGKILGKHSTPALATVILLSFTKLLNIVTKIFSPIRIRRQCGDGDIDYYLAWFSDASISFENPKHIVLLVIAVFMTVFFILPYTLLLVSSPFLHRFNQYRVMRWVARLKPFIDAYEGPYNGSKRYWTGFLLVVRISLMFAFALNIYGYNQFQLFIIAITSIVLIFLTIRGNGIYHSKALNYLESLSIFNLAVYSVVVQYLITLEEKKGLKADKYVSYASLSVLGVTVFLIVLLRITIVILGKCGIVEEDNVKPWILNLWKLNRNLKFFPSSLNSTNGPRSMMGYETFSDEGGANGCEDSSGEEDLWKKSVREYREPLLEPLAK